MAFIGLIEIMIVIQSSKKNFDGQANLLRICYFRIK